MPVVRLDLSFDRAAKRLTFRIPDDAPGDWPAGTWTVALLLCPDPDHLERRTFTSEPAGFALMPTMTPPGGVPPPTLVVQPGGAATRVSLFLTVSPGLQVRDGVLAQQITVFAGPCELPLSVHVPTEDAPPVLSDVEFVTEDADLITRLREALTAALLQKAKLYTRVRVDGADSSLVKLPFDPTGGVRRYDEDLLLDVSQLIPS
jgi:hypothetical protein